MDLKPYPVSLHSFSAYTWLLLTLARICSTRDCSRLFWAIGQSVRGYGVTIKDDRFWPKAATRLVRHSLAGNDPKQAVGKRGAKVLSRNCPNCSSESILITELILSDVTCTNCGQLVGVHWLFRSVFFVIILVATLLITFVVLIDQGFYAALIMISVPIGALGFVKARFCPLVLKGPKPESQNSSAELGRPLTRD